MSKYPITDEKKINNYINNHKTTMINKYVVIHYEDKLYAVDNFKYVDNLLKGKITTINPIAQEYYEKSLKKRNITIPSKHKKFRNQLHIKVNNLEITESNDFQIDNSQILQISSIEINIGPAFAISSSAIAITASAIVVYVIEQINYIIH